MPDRKERRQREPDYTPGHHRLLPQDSDAEQSYLGSVLRSAGEVLDEHRLPAAAFFVPARRTIYEQLEAMRDERRPIDISTVTSRLRSAGVLEEIGGPSVPVALWEFIPTAANVRAYAETLREKLTLRELIIHCRGIESRCFSEQDQVKDLAEEAVTGTVEIAAGHGTDDTIRHVKGHAFKAFEEIEYAYANRGRTIGIPTGFADLDRMLGGWQRGYTYYFGARPAMGKSSLGLNLSINAAAASAECGCPVLFFSVEMTGVQLAKRLIFTLAEMNQQRARDGFLSRERDFAGLQRAVEAVASSHLFIDETAALTIADFRARVRRWIKKIRRTRNGGAPRADGKPDGMIWIDYLQRMKGSSKRAEDARYLELQEIAQGISQTAKELDIPIAVLAQLKRPRDKKPDTEPDMTEFRECGDIEQEAHVVALIHRPHYYVKGNLEKQQALADSMQERMRVSLRCAGRAAQAEKLIFGIPDLERYAKLIIDKQREGPVGSVDLRFIADYTKFETWDPERARYSNNADQRQVTEEAAG